MNSMTHRERVLTAISGKSPDSPPIDIGSHRDGTIHTEAYERLKKHFRIDSPVALMDRMQQAAKLDEPLLRKLDVDTRGIFLGVPEINLGNDLEDGTWIDAWGIARHKPDGAKYFDQKGKAPLSGDISIEDIKNYPLPDPYDPGYVKGVNEQIEHYNSEDEYALVLNLPAPIVHVTQFLRGFEDWYMDLAINQDILESLMDACLEVNIEMGKRVLELVGDKIDVAMTADDLGTQDRLQFSPEVFRKIIKPRLKKYFDMIHDNTDAKLLFHTCGSVYPIIGDLIDIGMDVLNPVQPRAKDMSPAKLKQEFGKDISFWGGVDIQHTMSFGSPEDVKIEVIERFKELGEDGGWVVGATHNMQPETPAENILSMCETARAISLQRLV